MADTMYRRPLTLEDVLLGANAGTEAPVAPAPPGQASGSGFLSPVQQQSALETLLRPTDLGPEPSVDKRSVGSEIFNALGDALGAYAAGVTGGPRTDYTGRYFGRRELQKQEREQFRKQAALIKTQDERQKAEFLLNQDERSRNKAEAIDAAKQLRDMGIKQQQDEWKQRGIEAAAREAQDLVQQQNAQNFQREMQANELKARKYSDDLQAGLNRKKKTDEDDKDQHKTVLELRQGVVAAKAQTIADLQAGKVTPDQVEEEWQDTLDASGLLGDYRDAADAFYRAKMTPILMRFAPQQGPEGPPNPQSATGYALGQLGQAAMSGLKTATTPFVNVPKKK